MKYSILTPTYNQLPLLMAIRDALQKQKGSPDYEWILAIDGSDDNTLVWADQNDILWVHQEHSGRRYNQIVNKAAERASGDYLVFIAGDSIPATNFFAEIDPTVARNRMVTGTRMDVDEAMKIVRPDYRVGLYNARYGTPLKGEPVELTGPHFWEFMTSNSLVFPREVWQMLKGFDEVYKGYGVVDQDLALRAHYELALEAWWVPNAILMHQDLVDKVDDPGNREIFNKRLAAYALQK